MLIESYVREYARLFGSFDRNVWNYEDGCVIIGLDAMYGATGDEFYYNSLKSFTDRYVHPDGTIRLFDKEAHSLDSIPSGRVFFRLYQATHDVKYRNAIEELFGQIKTQPRAKCGSFWHKRIYPNQIWLDGLYMCVPFYLMHANLTGNKNEYADALKQFENCRKHLFDEEAGLYYHAWCEDKSTFWCDKETGLSKNFWLRSIGWHLMALTDSYELLPESEKDGKRYLAESLKEEIDGLLKWQDEETGLFFQLPALPEMEGNYLETSGSLMVAYALFKGVRLNILEKGRCSKSAMSILLGICAYKFSFSHGALSLDGICKGAGLGPEGNWKRDGSAKYYLSEEVVSDEQKAVGVLMMAYAEYLKARSEGAIADGIPSVHVFDKKYDAIMPDDPDFKETF